MSRPRPDVDRVTGYRLSGTSPLSWQYCVQLILTNSHENKNLSAHFPEGGPTQATFALLVGEMNGSEQSAFGRSIRTKLTEY